MQKARARRLGDVAPLHSFGYRSVALRAVREIRAHQEVLVFTLPVAAFARGGQIRMDENEEQHSEHNDGAEDNDDRVIEQFLHRIGSRVSHPEDQAVTYRRL